MPSGVEEYFSDYSSVSVLIHIFFSFLSSKTCTDDSSLSASVVFWQGENLVDFDYTVNSISIFQYKKKIKRQGDLLRRVWGKCTDDSFYAFKDYMVVSRIPNRKHKQTTTARLYSVKQHCEVTKFCVFWGIWMALANFPYFYLESNAVIAFLVWERF